MTTKVYVEGAGPRRAQQSQCRRAFAMFFAASGVRNRPAILPCGGRNKAFEDFCTALRTSDPDTFSFLLVDAEGPVDAQHTTWQHLKSRDGWDTPSGATDDQAFLMVQVMEAWFLADPDALRQRFGDHFSTKPFRKWPDLEAVPKQTVYEVLEKATTSCKQRYQKGDVAFEILAFLNPKKVEDVCPHALRLLERLRNL